MPPKECKEKIVEIEKQYEPQKHEKRIYEFWEKSGLHRIDITDKDPFCIVIPPPNITGRLHMGHALNNTIQDILIRYKRLKGFNALWIPGTDHAGIATHTVVEKKIAKEKNLTRWDMGREDFEKEIWKWRNEFGSVIFHQLRSLLVLPDWTKERFTLDEGLSNAVYKVFETLFNEGLIYRGNYIVNWCPRCHTALADTEVEHKDVNSHLWYIRYPLVHPAGAVTHITVATTRPETMLGDTAVAVNPKDERYKHLIGREVLLPVSDRPVKIIADQMVDMEFGTGAVKITPFHDPNDFETAVRHNLRFEKVIDENALMTGSIPERFIGKSTEEARKMIVTELQEKGLLEKTADHLHAVTTCYRCSTVLEPLVSKQWFIKMKALAEPAIKEVEEGRINFIPGKWAKYYLNWMYEIRDWCISRQLWWGHRIPVFYCDDCSHGLVAKEKPGKCPKCGGLNMTQDEDVLDTWFSSALWPFSTMGWPEKTDLLKKYYPTSVLVTDRGIIFNWVARMIIMGMKFMKLKPFFDVYIHGTILDSIGRKMSKSLGNGIDPLEMSEKYGADAVRFSLVSMTSFGQDIYLSENKFETGRNFANKIWNAMRFILLNVKEGEAYEDSFSAGRTMDKWMMHELSGMILGADGALKEYNFNEYTQVLYHFFWDSFCDKYIEAAKSGLDRKEMIQNLLYAARRFLIALSPVMPALSEVLYGMLPNAFKKQKSIILEEFPEAEKGEYKKEAETVEDVFSWITLVRRARKDFGIKPSLKIEIMIRAGPAVRNVLEEMKSEFLNFTGAGCISFGDFDRMEHSISIVTPGIVSFIPAKGIMDIKKELARLRDQYDKCSFNIESQKKRLGNSEFTGKAPPEVVETLRKSLAGNEELLKEISVKIENLK